MIDYTKINKEITQKKWDNFSQSKNDKFTCYYDEYNHHELCPHPEQCILDQKFQRLYVSIQNNKKQKKNLEKIYTQAIELKKENPEKQYSELFYGLSFTKNNVERATLTRKIKQDYEKLRELKTRKGGY